MGHPIHLLPGDTLTEANSNTKKKLKKALFQKGRLRTHVIMTLIKGRSAEKSAKKDRLLAKSAQHFSVPYITYTVKTQFFETLIFVKKNVYYLLFSNFQNVIYLHC